MGWRRGRKGKRSENLISDHGEGHEVESVGEERVVEGKGSGGFFACYLLHSLSPRYKGHTYIGFTVNPRRRIRQHNGEIRSGAWRTKRKRPWEMVLCVYGFPTNVSALQFEWAWQHPRESIAVRKAAATFKSLSGVSNKIKLAYTMLTLAEWENLNLTVNFFSTKHMKDIAHCPRLPEKMTVSVCAMDELPCYGESQLLEDDDCYDDCDGLNNLGCDDGTEDCDETCSLPVEICADGSFLQSERAHQAKERPLVQKQMKPGNIENVENFNNRGNSLHEFQCSVSAVEVRDSSSLPPRNSSDEISTGDGFPFGFPSGHGFPYDFGINSSDEASCGNVFPAGVPCSSGGSSKVSDGFPAGGPCFCDHGSNLSDSSTPLHSIRFTGPASDCNEPHSPPGHDVIDLSTPTTCNFPSRKRRLPTCPQIIDLTDSPVIIHL